MKRLILTLVCLFAVPLAAHAQTAIPSNHLGWTQAGPDAATVQAYVYRHYDDGSATGATLAGISCTATGAGSFACQATFPAFTPTGHTLTITAANAAGESSQSAPISFTFVVIPSTPTALHIVMLVEPPNPAPLV